MLEKIIEHLENFNLDLRKSKNGRFMDQKVTPDVLSFIADCILNFTSGKTNKEFCIKDIWGDRYFKKNTEMIFGKPSPDDKTATHEYDKFIAQPVNTLEYSHILKSTTKGKTKYYKINNLELLEYISIKDKNAYNFLSAYLRKVLIDSGFIKYINDFIKKAKNNTVTKEDFYFLKSKYENFIIGNTKINGKTEVRRIFTKVINIFSVENNTLGTMKGHLSKQNIYYQDLMYNRINFRDVEKEKRISRGVANLSKSQKISYKKYNDYLVRKAMDFIKKKYKESEIKDSFAKAPAIYVHHIFPKNEFPEISYYLENLIKLTAEQHYSHAHPKGNTQIINKEYQLVCLLAKSNSIEKSITKGEFFYSKPNFIFVINNGLNLKDNKKINEKFNFNQIREELKTIYKNI